MAAWGRACLLVMLVAAGGCVPPQRAHLAQLQHRAVFDLGCPVEQLWIHHVDARTKVVVGCGRRLVYAEDCGGDPCSWRLDSPWIGQSQWPQFPVGGAPVAAAAPPAAAPAAPAPVGQGRIIQTELFGERRGRVVTPEERRIETDLFDER